MDQFFYHCDIKPDNMMLMGIGKETILEMSAKKIYPVRLDSNSYFQVKYIDFGLLTSGEVQNRECQGGTNGFKPDEYLSSNILNDKFDVYSLGMTFLSLELSNLGYIGFDRIDSILHKRKKVKERKLTEDDIEKLDSLDLVERMKTLMTSDDYRQKFLEKLEIVYPSLKESLESNSINYYDLDPLEVLNKDVFGYRHFMESAISTYFNDYLPEVKTKQGSDAKEEKINKLKLKIQSLKAAGKNVTMLEAELKYLEAKLELYLGGQTLTTSLVNLYLRMIKRKPTQRLSLQQVISKITTLKNNFYEEFSELIDEVELYEDSVPENEEMNTINLEEMESKVNPKPKRLMDQKDNIAIQTKEALFSSPQQKKLII
jgi:serine/threonine protein kinase